MTPKKILYLAQEMPPYTEEDLTLGTLSLRLPQSIQEAGHDIRAFMPNFGTINERRNQLHEVRRLSTEILAVDDRNYDLVVKVATLQPAKMQIYFTDNKDFFQRKGALTDEQGALYSDNVHRAVFYLKGVFKTIELLQWIPDIIHCQGWFTGLVPLYLKTFYKDNFLFSRAKVVYSHFDGTPTFPYSSETTSVLANDQVTHPLLNGEEISREKFISLVADHSDGLILSSPENDPGLLRIIEASSKPHISYTDPSSSISIVEEFYASL